MEDVQPLEQREESVWKVSPEVSNKNHSPSLKELFWNSGESRTEEGGEEEEEEVAEEEEEVEEEEEEEGRTHTQTLTEQESS